MQIMRKLIITAALLLVAAGSFAMRCDTDTVRRGPLFDKFQLRQSFQDATAKESPAQLMLTIPSSGGSSWLVDAGVAARVVPLSGVNSVSNLVGEFHRNTLISNPQYNWQLGFNYAYLHTKPDGQFALSWTANAKYVRDVIDTAHSVATTLSIGFYRTGKDYLNFGRPRSFDNQKMTYQIDPSVQVQYQQYFGNDLHTGGIVRPLVSLAASLAWNSARTKGLAASKKFELAASYTNRYAAANNTGNGERYTKLLSTGINYYFINSASSTVSVGASYNLGSDPLNGLKDQNFLQFAFQVQI
ncbi:hypothetical protein GCM10022210_26580 [Mucilaginibacter dorajii]|uniref:DUF2860 domain-containing protein n=2 Tax=Mucilaginibacter dorajii TaxID=692994 RepID=A0ABP7Q496_9SPHI